MVEVGAILADLGAESAEVDRLVAPLPAARWRLDTPAAGWTIAHQVAHLAWTDRAALLAITDPGSFADHLLAAMASPATFVDDGASEFLSASQALAEPPAPPERWRDGHQDLLDRWRGGREALREALATVPAGTRITWYATTMSPASMATARLMETWAHGLDIAEALDVPPRPTLRLRHIAHLGHRTLGYSFAAHGLAAPSAPVRVELVAPDGAVWTFGPSAAADIVTGPALDFCLLVTQRRHRDDLQLVASGPVAQAWLDIAQAFAGPPGAGRRATGDRDG